jgi:hypothetical protein
MERISFFLSDCDVKPIRWDDPDTFVAGGYTFDELLRIASEVDFAVFLFSEDDKVWYRGEGLPASRDNVILEYGLFCGLLGRDRVAIIRIGSPKNPSDLHGICYMQYSPDDEPSFRISVRKWIKAALRRQPLNSQVQNKPIIPSESPNHLRLLGQKCFLLGKRDRARNSRLTSHDLYEELKNDQELQMLFKSPDELRSAVDFVYSVQADFF